MKRMHVLSLFLLTHTVAHASIPVSLSGPVPAIASNYLPGDSSTIVYTITNNVPNRSFPISVNGLQAPLTRATVANDCGNTLPLGPATCNIGVLIAPTSSNAGAQINQTLSINYQGRKPLLANIAFNVGPTPTSSDLLISAGEDTTGTQPPLIVQSTSGGVSWSVQTIIGATLNGLFYSADCTGNGTNAICIAAGVDNTGTTPPLLAQTTNGGTSWSVPIVPGLPSSGTLVGTACTGMGSSAICIAVGTDTTAPVLAQSTNGGSTWSIPTITGLPAGGNFNAASCTGTGSGAICIAVGADSISGAALLAQSTDGGTTWAVQSIPGLPASSLFSGASCTGSASTATCVAAGRDSATTEPLLAQSTDGGTTWAVHSISGLPSNGILNAANCTGSGGNTICVAGGRDTTGVQPPLLVVSTDNGTTWATKAVTGSPATGFYQGVSCVGAGSSAFCVAVGAGPTGLIAESTDGANTWNVVSVSGLPVGVPFNAVSCTGTGATAKCVAAGGGFGSNPPLLVQTTNGGASWSMVTIPSGPATGLLVGAGTTS
jgi:hypothetical protein